MNAHALGTLVQIDKNPNRKSQTLSSVSITTIHSLNRCAIKTEDLTVETNFLNKTLLAGVIQFHVRLLSIHCIILQNLLTKLAWFFQRTEKGNTFFKRAVVLRKTSCSWS